jgi:hypothetical protein
MRVLAASAHDRTASAGQPSPRSNRFESFGGLDTTTPAGKAMFGMMGVFAEFERTVDSGARSRGLGEGKG